MDTIKTAMDAGNMLLVVGAVAIPVLAAVTQWINYVYAAGCNDGQ